MAALVNRGEALAIRRFIARLRRILWLRGLRKPMLYSGGASAAILLAVGVASRFGQPLPLLPCLGVAALPPLACLLASVFKLRTDAESTAIAADRLFAGKSLMTTALALLVAEPPVDNPLAAHTLHRAACAAADWNARMGELPKPVAGISGWVSAAMALAGVFLLALAPMVPPDASPPAQNPPPAQSLAEEPARLMADVAAIEKPAPKAVAQSQHEPLQASFGVPDADAPPASAADGEAAAAQGRPSMHKHGSTVESGGLPQGEGAGAGTDPNPQPLAEAGFGNAGFDTLRVDIARHGGDSAKRASLPFNGETAPAQASSRAGPPPAAASAEGGAGFSRLSAAQRHYADAYFHIAETP